MEVQTRLRAAGLAGFLLLTGSAQGAIHGLRRGQTATLEGTLEVVVEDRHDGSELRRASIRTAQGAVPINSDDVPLGASSGMDVTVTVYQGPRGQDVIDWSLLDPFQEEEPYRVQERVAVILLRFSEEGEPLEPGFSRSQVEGLVFRDGARYLDDVSYGKLGIEGQVAGWYTLPFGPTCDYERVRDWAIRLADGELDYRIFDRVVLAYPNASCNVNGLGTIGKTVLSTRDGEARASIMWLNGTIATWVFVHEYGHNLGLQHASSLSCNKPGEFDSACWDSEYSDPYDGMGNVFPGHYSFPSKVQLGWLKEDQVFKVRRMAGREITYVVRLTPLELKDGLKGIEIPFTLPSGQPAAYYIEYRQRIGEDAKVQRGVDGALVRVSMQSEHRNIRFQHTHILAMPGKPWWDPHQLDVGTLYADPVAGIEIEPLDRTEQDLFVRLTLSPIPDENSADAQSYPAPFGDPY